MREEERRLFPLSTIGSVVQLFRLQLSGSEEPDIALLSIVSGCVENSLTSPRTGGVAEDASTVDERAEYFEEPEVADVENLRIEPVVELHIVEALYSKFHAVIRGYCDLSLYQEPESKTASRGLVKRISDIIWNTLAKAQYKDRAHLQSIYSYLTGSKLDCFGVAIAVIAGCQVLGFSDVHLTLSEDHAWVVFGDAADQTAEVTWHGKGNEDKRGLPVDGERVRDSWLYVGGQPVHCSRHMEVAALVSSINPAMTPSRDCLEVSVLQQELLWLLYDLGHLERYPMALGNLGDLEELSASPGRLSSEELYHEAVAVARTQYGDHHVYPYTYLAGFHYRQRDFKGALRSWADAANVIKRYKYSKDDEEIYKEFMEINNELIPHILKADEHLLQDPECFGSLLQFYDGLCSWEEDSSTPVLHIGWVKPIVKTLGTFDFSVRTRLDIALEDKGKDGLLSLSEWSLERDNNGQLSCVPQTLNNNYKESVEDCDEEYGGTNGHYEESLYKEESYLYNVKSQPSATQKDSHEDFDGMHVNRLLRLAKIAETETGLILDDRCTDASKEDMLISFMKKSGDQLFNIDFLLGNLDSEPFLGLTAMEDLASLHPPSPRLTFPTSKAPLLAEARRPGHHGGGKGAGLSGASLGKDGRVRLKIFSSKIGDLKPLLQSEKLNSSALHLHLTAQSQTEVKKSRSSFEADFSSNAGGRVKRQRRE